MFAAVILAAGLSTRMGRPKLLLPWGDTTVIGQVVRTFADALSDSSRSESAIAELIVVTGGAHDEIQSALVGLPVRCVFNPQFEQDAMLASLQVGLAALGARPQAAFIALGDQPQVQSAVIQQLASTYQVIHPTLLVPSYHLRRGHPWLLDRALWSATLAAPLTMTMRDFLNQHADQIQYVVVDTPTVLQDLDTPEDYARFRP